MHILIYSNGALLNALQYKVTHRLTKFTFVLSLLVSFKPVLSTTLQLIFITKLYWVNSLWQNRPFDFLPSDVSIFCTKLGLYFSLLEAWLTDLCRNRKYQSIFFFDTCMILSYPLKFPAKWAVYYRWNGRDVSYFKKSRLFFFFNILQLKRSIEMERLYYLHPFLIFQFETVSAS